MSKAKPELKLVEDTGSQLQDEDLSAELPPQQSEMPFAVVEGEPVTQLPRDLYIPPDALQVFLTAFEGPLDLLLYLIRKQNLDILNIPIAEITRQYMQYIEVMAEMQLELAGEYLLMAAMLAEIKSRMLLPRPPVVEGQEEEDPRAELVRRLQEYERFKKAAEDLDKLNRLERDNITASAELEERKVVKLLPDVTLKEMLDAFRDVLSRAEKFAHHHISRERLSQRERMTEILARLQTVAFFEFRQLFKPEEGRMGVTVTFIAILELMKEGLIEIVQAEAYAPIHVRTAQRNLKVVQGGPAASETADAENEAALAQPELVGENDIPDEDETPPADDAAVAVEAAVADVAAASSIAVDSIEADNTVSHAGFVEAAVSEAIASTENAVETVAEVAATDEAAVAAAVAEEVTAGSPVVIDEAAPVSPVAEDVAIDPAVIESAAADIAAEEESLIESGAVDRAAEEESLIESGAVDSAAEETSLVESAAVDGAPEESSLVESAAVASAPEDSTMSSHVYDEVTLEDVPAELGAVEQSASEDDPLQAQTVAPVSDLEAVVEQVTESGVSPMVDGLPEDAVAQDEAITQSETASAELESFVSAALQPVEAVAALESEGIAAFERGESEEDAGSEEVEEHVVEEHAVEEHVVPEHVIEEHVVPEPAVEEQASLVEVVAEHAQTSEPVEVIAEAGPIVEPIEVASEDAPIDDTTNVVGEDAPADETTNVVIEQDAVAPVTADAAEHDEAATEHNTDLSEPDVSKAGDSVTGASTEADNSDAEPTR